MKILQKCKDYSTLKSILSMEQLKNIDNILIHYENNNIDTESYINEYGNGNIISWYEGVVDTRDFLRDIRDNL